MIEENSEKKPGKDIRINHMPVMTRIIPTGSGNDRYGKRMRVFL